MKDARAQSVARARRFVAIASLTVVFLVLVSGWLSRILSRDLRSMISVLNRLAAGEAREPVPQIAARDEVGDMARGLEVFRESIRALRLREQAIEASPVGIAFAERGREGHPILYANRAFGQLTGRDTESLIGQPLASVLGEDAAPEQRETLEAAVEAGSDLTLLLLSQVDDIHRFVDLRLAPTRMGGSEITHNVVILSDVTEQKELETQLLQSQKMEAIGQLAAGLAHDYNNYLTVIMANVEALAMEIDDEELKSTVMADIIDAVQMSASLTRQLLTLGRKQAIVPRDLDLNQLIESTQKMLRRVLGEHVELVIHCAPDLAPIHADPSQVEQIAINLALNARDAMPDGGTLSLETSNVTIDRADLPRVGSSQPGGYVRLRVSDTGMGMDEVTVDRIFEPFFTTKEAGRGSGLGLASIQVIIEQIGGFIRVESKPGAGTIFEVLFPVSPEDEGVGAVEPVAERGSAEKALRRRGRSLLLVEDDAGVRSVTRQILESSGLEVLTAADGPSALAILEQRSVDLLLTDLVMPVMGGIEVADRALALDPDLRVLYMSGYAEGEVIQTARRAPKSSFLAKPFTKADLLARVDDILGPPPPDSPSR